MGAGPFYSCGTWRGSILSTYLARRSNSRLTGSPIWARSRLVERFVVGMSQTAKLFGKTSATVKLIPLMAIDPL